MLGQNDHYVGTNLFFLDIVSMIIHRSGNEPMMLYSRADINNVLVSGEILLYTVPPFCLFVQRCQAYSDQPEGMRAEPKNNSTDVELFDSTGMTLFLNHCFQIPMVQN